MSDPHFGDIIENGWASTDNPTRRGYFVRKGYRRGRMNAGPYYEVTDGRGNFWELPLGIGHKITVVTSSAVLPTPAETGGDVSPNPTANSGES